MKLLASFSASAVMLSMAQAPIGWWALAWVAYVPFIVAGVSETKPLRLCLVAYAAGAGFWLGNIYWMSFVTVAGWIAFCLYTALLWPILAMSIRWCQKKKIPLVIAFPVLVVGIEQCQGLSLGGFYWLYLGHSQYQNTTLTQIADIFGASGVSFLVAMVNGLIAQLIITAQNLEFRIENSEKKRLRYIQPFLILHSKFSILFVIAAVAGSFVYGKWRIEQTARCVSEGPIVAAVQTNVPQSVKQSFAAEEQILDDLLKDSNQCLTSEPKPGLIVWPETMVQAILEGQVLRLLDESHQYKQFDKAIRGLAEKGAYVLAGAYGGTPKIEKNWDIRMAKKFNAAFLYQPDGNQSPQTYYKIHLVPFGEYLPFKDVPIVHNLLIKMSPYDFDYTLDAGSEYTAFEMDATHKFGVIICYEDAVPYVVRRFILDEQGRKRVDWLVNISNDGWFVGFDKDRVRTSTELAQHTVVCSFRAIENRTAILRSVNTGISCLIDTLGRIRNGYVAGNLPQNAFDRQGVAGWFADKVPIDSRITAFSKYGQWLDFSCQLCLAGIIIAQINERFVIKKQNKKK